ncbi:cytochrome c [candidate division KSB1 bacterium]|nr:cytochrome c [candidate division KSB1 bacterium]RQW00472.1 MAG: cytochrome c [candidate division KSB1 bacterium]
MLKLSKVIFLTLLSVFVLTSCYRGQPKKKPPIHLIPDMDSQPRYDAQEYSSFFQDGSTMRTPIQGTVALGELKEDIAYHQGKDERGNFVKENPVPVTLPVLRRGQDRFDIYCAPCHGRIGDGNGIVVKRGYLPPPTLHQDRLRRIEDGHMYDVIKNGIRNMPSYAHQIPVDDRWAITAYIRALQRSQNAAIDDVPEEIRGKIKK